MKLLLQNVRSSVWRNVRTHEMVDLDGRKLSPFCRRFEAISLIKRTFLPANFPASVHPNYLFFTIWNFVQSATGSIVSVISTQSLLYGLGLNSSGGLAMAATLNWVLKDGIGQLGGIIFVSLQGHRFDPDAKRYRFLAALLLKVAMLLEILAPLMPRSFLILASLANACKNISWMAVSATRAQMHRQFARGDIMGDLSGKAAAQNTFAGLVGTAAGAAISAVYLSGSTDIVSRCLWIFLPISAFSLFASYQSCRWAVSPRLSLYRLNMIINAMLPNIVSKQGRRLKIEPLERYILPPEIVSMRESFIFPNRPFGFMKKYEHVPIIVEPPVGDVPANVDSLLKEKWIMQRTGRAINIWFAHDATDISIIKGIFAANLQRYCGSGDVDQDLFSDVLEGLKKRGWWTNDHVQLGVRRPLKLVDA